MKEIKRLFLRVIACLLLATILLLSACNEQTVPPTPSEPPVTTPVASSQPTEAENPTSTDTQPSIESVMLNGAPLSDWVIAVNTQELKSFHVANSLVSYFSQYTGEEISIVTQNTVKGNEKNMIVLGGRGRTLQRIYDFEGDYFVTENDERGSVISLYSSAIDGIDKLVERMKDEMVEVRNENTLSLTISECEYIYFFAEDEIPKWNLVSETRSEIAKGVTYIRQFFRDEENLPYRTYALILDPAYVELQMGSSNDGYELVPTEKQTTLQHMQAAVANGKNVIAGINANFFNINGDYSPSGLALKDGFFIYE